MGWQNRHPNSHKWKHNVCNGAEVPCVIKNGCRLQTKNCMKWWGTISTWRLTPSAVTSMTATNIACRLPCAKLSHVLEASMVWVPTPHDGQQNHEYLYVHQIINTMSKNPRGHKPILLIQIVLMLKPTNNAKCPVTHYSSSNINVINSSTVIPSGRRSLLCLSKHALPRKKGRGLTVMCSSVKDASCTDLSAYHEQQQRHVLKVTDVCTSETTPYHQWSCSAYSPHGVMTSRSQSNGPLHYQTILTRL